MEQEPEGPPAAACSGMASEPLSFICVTAKSPGASTQLVLPESSTVLQFKEELARHFGCQASQLVLVFFGRILKDQDTLRQSGVRDGMTVHLLVRALKRDQEDLPAAAAAAAAAALPSAAAAMLPEEGDVAGSPPLPASVWGPPEAEPSSAEWQLLPTSERIIQKVRQVILANPEVQQLAQQIPAISHILNNMDIMRVILDKMREIMDLARNPEVLQDLKNQDPSLVGLQNSIPGGDNPLRQLTGEMPEPSLNAMQDLFVASPFAAMGRTPCCPEVPQQASGLRLGQGPGSTEARGGRPPDSLPVSRSCTSICSNGSCSEEGGAFATLANPLGHRSPMSNPGPSAGTGRFSAGGGAPNPDAAAAAAAEIPTLIVNLCNAYTKRMMFSLMQDALLASEGTPAAQQERTSQQILHFAQQMQSPDMMAAMSNPKAIQAWVQMEQGLQTLAAEAPVLIPWFTLRLRGLLGSSTGAPPGLSDASCPESAVSE